MMVRVTWDLPAISSQVMLSRRSARMLLEHHSICNDDIDAVELVLGEMCANVVRHAYPSSEGRYRVEMELEDACVRVRVSDDGCGFEPNWKTDGSDFDETGGMGLFLASQFSDHLQVESGNGNGSAICAERRLHHRDLCTSACAS